MTDINERDTDDHLRRIEREAKKARGEVDSVNPWDYTIPSPWEFSQLRQRCGLTQADVAERIGRSTNTITAIEGGQSQPGFRTLIGLLRLYREEWPDK